MGTAKYNCESEEIVEAANIAISNLLPTKSRSLYDIAYNRTGDGYQAKKSKILTKSEIDRFLSSADDKEFLMIKVGLILGIAGACRTDELVNLTVDDIEDVGSSLIVKIPNTKTKIPRIFVVTDRKCSSQPVGKNTMEKIPSVVASYLKLPDVALLYWSLLTKIFSDITGRCWCGYHDNKASCWLEINDSR
ncbi:hypothetical protein NQ317_014508 [Molorchus minor]|uniref:Tyr recombinase domain-containing protein n=1 Tax=Molorchus minor TaxID=1323400 RepID=A0ABQ9JJA3_9CUCU|nr:hypothetical protein NQ317_014508 [Molorchus minor]